ncbi:MAG: Hsp70 family protein [Solobacterium sp.]|nr:Hsp70 family protein [Solobacterium sp.]
MDRFYGFDLGDAESAVTRLQKDADPAPQVLSVHDEKSFITAYALLKNGQLVVGEGACYEPEAVKRKIRFKSHFLTDSTVSKDIASFASGVLGELYLNGDLIKGEENCFYIGCPAGWDRVAREEYREIFEKIGFPPTRIISESRAALVSACQSKHLQVGYDILSKPVLVVDVGSSTTDFAYVNSGKEVELQTGGEVFLGGGIMDEVLLEEAVSASKDEKKIRKIFEESEAWKTYCEFAARRLKEKYFKDEEYWKDQECTQTVTIRYTRFPVKLVLRMNAQIAEKLIEKKVAKLDNRSFKDVFTDALKQARDNISDRLPELIFLTGGVSKMPVIRSWCREVFPESIVITSGEPEFSVAAGLAYCGKIDDELREFKNEIEQLKSSSVVEQIVEQHMNELYRSAVDDMVSPIMREVALPVIDQWRNGTIEKLAGIDEALKTEIDNYLHTDRGRAILTKSVSSWLKNISYELEKYTVPICTKHNVPYSALSLNSYLSLSDIEIRVEAKDVFALKEITWMIDTVVSLLVGFLCGGSGIAMIANGVPGILAGAVISLMVLALGKNKMQEAFLNANIPHIARKMFPKKYFEARLDVISDEVKKGLYANLEQEKNEVITERLIKDISEQIEICLTKMAEVVEIPLG